MEQFFIFGSSNAHGVGGIEGWANLLQKHLHEKMYAEDGLGEIYEVYNFSKPGATSSFVLDTFENQIKQYKKDKCKITSILSVGLNDAKAAEQIDNYVSTPEKFKESMQELIFKINKQSDRLVVLLFWAHDESKTMPKLTPSGGYSYFSNKRTSMFNDVLKEICDELEVKTLEITKPESYWINNCLYKDGLHPNQRGHNLVYKELIKHLELI